jgi:hypothetical protein
MTLSSSFGGWSVHRCERVVSEAERVLLVDVERTRDSLRGFIGDLKMMAGEKYGELIAPARIEDATLMRRCLSSKGNKCGVAHQLSPNLLNLQRLENAGRR